MSGDERFRRLFLAANRDRRLAWRELGNETERAVEAERALKPLRSENESLRVGIEMERRINTESGCPDCGVHAGCAEVVAERDQLRRILAAIRLWVGVVDDDALVRMVRSGLDERDELRAAVAEYQRTLNQLDADLEDDDVDGVGPQFRDWKKAEAVLLGLPTAGNERGQRDRRRTDRGAGRH